MIASLISHSGAVDRVDTAIQQDLPAPLCSFTLQLHTGSSFFSQTLSSLYCCFASDPTDLHVAFPSVSLPSNYTELPDTLSSIGDQETQPSGHLSTQTIVDCTNSLELVGQTLPPSSRSTYASPNFHKYKSSTDTSYHISPKLRCTGTSYHVSPKLRCTDTSYHISPKLRCTDTSYHISPKLRCTSRDLPEYMLSTVIVNSAILAKCALATVNLCSIELCSHECSESCTVRLLALKCMP